MSLGGVLATSRRSMVPTAQYRALTKCLADMASVMAAREYLGAWAAQVAGTVVGDPATAGHWEGMEMKVTMGL